MRVLSIANSGAHLPESYDKSGYNEEYKFPISVGKSYVVYAMNLWAGKIRFLIAGESHQIPSWLPSELFEIMDSKLSRYWYCDINPDSSENTIDFVWGYKELTDNSDHFDKLVDWDKIALEIFNRYKELMDLEFPDPEITRFATVIDGGEWLLCPNCQDAFASQSLDAMIKCSTCRAILNNPRYINE